MAIGVIETTVTTVHPSASAVAADNNLRIVSLALGAYEYVVNCYLPTSHGDLESDIRLVISSPSLQNIGYITPLIDEGEKDLIHPH
jgi:hypothetical protein